MNTLFEPEDNYKTGWIKIFRSIRNHWIWQDERKLKWWIDILLEVNHSGKSVPIGYKVFECNRGECLVSLQNWSFRWNVSKSVVNNFFAMLEKDKMITLKNETVTTRLTVCNYETYQEDQNAFKTQQKRKKTEQSTTKNEENEKNINTSVFIYSEFYDNQIKISQNNPDYVKFVKYIYGGNDIEKRLNRVLGLRDQLTYIQFEKILTKSMEKNKKLRDMLLDLENNIAYTKGRTNLYSIFNSWLNRDLQNDKRT